MKNIPLAMLLLLFSNCAFGQDWEKRRAFAKTYFGVSSNIIPGSVSGKYLDENGNIQKFTRNGFVSPAINIGATHFWGYADLIVSINTADIKFGKDDIENYLSLNTFTGFRVYPFPSKEKTIRPYIGYQFSPFTYQQKDINDKNFKYSQVKSVFNAGIGVQTKNLYFTLEYGRILNSAFDTYLSRTVKSTDKFPSQMLSLGLNYMLETTKMVDDDNHREANTLFSQSNKWGLFVGLGPSSVFPMRSSEYVTDLYPFLNDRSFPNIFPEFSLGYEFSKSNFALAAAFRPIKQTRKAYDFEQEIKRNSFNLEAYKFLFDYHGFVPFIGFGTSYEQIKLNETDNNVVKTNKSFNKISPNFVFGWDIKPSQKGDTWVLRTNLRYYPWLDIENEGKKISLQQLEFNFIQLVIYPQKIEKTLGNKDLR